ncbi:restriction endonuclease subunit S [Zhongshania aquimaris]|uniref:Restriction endonuclease subunit S n=1 Tax=Zhongshania aquimaris TaxID=2857107 RepID=A0ABS6VS23_9GAMM|nr:restriction endonuclease subunit S [Zhongshania aquimaris]MBW2940511.1 restriction endonuclease subunit S [Zhongshania aquimaris]
MAFTKSIEELINEDTTGLLSKHDSWERVRLTDVAIVLNGFAFSSNHFNSVGKGLPLIRIRDIVSGETNTFYDGPYDEEYLIFDGDLLVGMDGDFNSAFWRSGQALLNQRVCKISIESKHYDFKFLTYLLPHYLDAVHQHTSSITVKHLSSATINNLLLPLPPEKAQIRIVEKLEELLSDLDNGVAELKAAQTKLTQYRQSLLKSAVEGSLTAEWRKQNPVTETGEQLLQRILTERRQRWEQQKLAEFKEKGKTPPKDWQKKYPEPVQPDTRELPELPEGWVWASVAQLGLVQLGRQRTPSKMYGNNPTKYIRAANITEEGIDFSDVLEMDFTEKEAPVYQLHAGDILLTEASGSPAHVGRPCIWPETEELYCFQNTVIRFTSIGLKPEFCFELFHAYQKLGKYMDIAGGVGINHLSAGKFSKIAVPLPPTGEQEALVKIIKTEKLLALQKLKAIENSLKQSEAQRKNILKEAFSGKLAPQNPNDEPASVLLEKIKAERAAQAKLPKPKRAKKKPNTMKNFDLDALKKWISELDKENFTFADMEAGASADYENLKNLIFLALSESKPVIYQSFDDSDKKMVFKKASA